ncbi:2-succinyl-5-enolpyruvyl-6-hydroxy-3-cyclohexene-1-carboxylic-acid synthase [Dysgonomonas sp. GY617]|uniref:2-succinyl-5-enolpyruvyl-6-hydroxy-3- cyclohexene-1-carboxylic-acid synthase n=1 Tax=Dysgonomonas sp. GY617 TaxID=2780420 RepID=UPI001883A57E|nr:2-succinyl-5-enolpyruvyl-6-hydroxy-3-cyclohexene-1-carboxylic-acid synthase [Dysgonomonas sp. GY617]MBF0576392.1 2-succinyl-5-enolpyruvyl-6-hydroxy-3-cyclohexene-1-carboxylic-acid synthase [Dysgonomonas sp. GY617]
MFSVKKNVLQTVALLKAYGVKQIVLSPGSRNAPLMQTFSQDAFFECHTIVDERNAAFYALGIIQALQQPVAICCTSGSALLNYAPAVSEAYYQQLPLIVVSADRSPEWIGQMDGQTLPQAGVFGSLSKKSVNLPEINSETDEWFCNRLINEALIACTADASGPVHINIPLYEPLFDYSEESLPEVRKIEYVRPRKSVDINPFIEKWNKLPKRLIIVGQQFQTPELTKLLESLAEKIDCSVFVENLSNCVSPSFIGNFDALLYTIYEEEKENFSPDLVITLGGHIVSKRLKHFIRQHKPKNHWHLTESGEVVDLFQSLTDLVETEAIDFFSKLSAQVTNEKEKPFFSLWKKASKLIPEPREDMPFSDISATGDFLKVLPKNSVLHLANSSTVRNVQLFQLDKSIKVYCNRGINGIESTLPSVVGFASVHKEPVYLIIGDLSFFYGLNALWNIQHIQNLRILLINNGGGGIFHLLPGLNKAPSLKEYVSAEHTTQAKDWALAAGLKYLSAENQDTIKENLKTFTTPDTDQSVLLEISTNMEISKKTFQEYYHKLKTRS